MKLTDGQRIVLAILAEPIEPNAIGGGVAPVANERVAAIWSSVLGPTDQADECRRHPRQVDRVC